MTLTPEQKNSVSQWIAAGDNLYAVQKKLADQFKISMTYMDVRFLVDGLNLELKDPAPKVDTSDVSKGAPAAPEKKGFIDKAKEKLGLAGGGEGGEEPLPAGGVSVTVDKVAPSQRDGQRHGFVPRRRHRQVDRRPSGSAWDHRGEQTRLSSVSGRCPGVHAGAVGSPAAYLRGS